MTKAQRTDTLCHPEPLPVILSAAKDLKLDDKARAAGKKPQAAQKKSQAHPDALLSPVILLCHLW